jgi:hypothetical protein
VICEVRDVQVRAIIGMLDGQVYAMDLLLLLDQTDLNVTPVISVM